MLDDVMLVVFKTNQKDYEMILFKTHSTQAASIHYVVSPPSAVSKKKLTLRTKMVLIFCG